MTCHGRVKNRQQFHRSALRERDQECQRKSGLKRRALPRAQMAAESSTGGLSIFWTTRAKALAHRLPRRIESSGSIPA